MSETQEAMFGAGCFWHIEDEFRRTDGVTSTRVGYAGGHTKNPSYKEVCAGDTGHAEVVHVQFNPHVISYPDLLEVFWAIHDPTSKDRQGPDVGSQYRSAAYYYNDQQKQEIIASKEKLEQSGRLTGAVVTEIAPAPEFYMAEDYHQQYMEKQRR